jgi:thiamine-phosphate pyrophosphorylase
MMPEFPRLIAITDLQRFSAERTLAVFRALAASARAGSVAVQLRAPGEPVRRLLELGAALKAIAANHGQWLIVNDRLDLAALLEADALHLGEASVSVADARRLWGARPLFRACHAPFAVSGLGADALLLSPIAAPRKGAQAVGLPPLSAAAGALARSGEATRLYALGGITPEAVDGCLSAGAFGVAAIEGVFAAKDLQPWLCALGISRAP